MHRTHTARRSPRFLPQPLLPALLLAPLLPGTATAQPAHGPSRPGIDIESYRFELTLRDDSDEIAGRATIALRFTADGVTEVPLDLTGRGDDGRGMEVLAVTSAGSPLIHSHQDDLLTVTLARSSTRGTLDSLTVTYRGTPASGLRIGPNKYGERTFFSDNWPNRARNWLPTVDHIGDKAKCEFVITAPAHYQVVSNGRLAEETDLDGGMRLTHWEQSVPISPWLFVVGVARFAVQNLGEFNGVPVQTWVYARDRDAGFYDFAVPTMDVLHFYDEYVGPFAYQKLANITSPATGGGMEAATALMYGENSVTGERSVRWRNVIIHEIAHQWFGNAVTESQWDDVWLSEGFATYFTLLFREHAYGRDDFVAGLREAADRVWRWYDENPNYRIVHDGLDDMSRVTSVATYQKGAWVLHMLRERLGDEAFWEGIRAYYARHFNGTATTDDFMHTMEEVSGDDLQQFFDQWLRQGGNPSLAGSWHYDPQAGAVVVELRQVQETGQFAMPLDVGFYMEGDPRPTLVTTVEIGAGVQRFVIPAGAEPSEVRLDPDTRALFRAEFGAR
ncbi:MAG: M1 family metallopeptidase [Gemmatimonadetes bacterium]|nr:M1 family metallopeptidase [Gemmatimonadota bacterium]